MRKWMGRGLLVLAFVLLPTLTGGLTFFLSAYATSRVGAMIASALIIHALVAFAFASLLLGRKRARIAAPISAAVFVVLGWALLFRRPPPLPTTMPDRGVVFTRVEVRTGPRLAVARLNEGASAVPLVFLHGGPGRPVTASDIAFFRSLSEQQLDVVLFDQAGTGESDPIARNAISLDRAIEDIEALREKLGVERITLLGQSWGARLAYEYTVKHRDRVDQLVLTGGAPLRADPREWKFDERRTALAHGDAGPFPTAILGALALQQINPAASEAFASREELSAIMATVVPTIMKRSVCERDGASVSSPPPLVGLDGSQFLVMRGFIEKNEAARIANPPPTLVLRTECDFAQWITARDYRDRLAGKMVFIEGAGHAVWPYRSDVARGVVAAFVHRQALPLPVYEGTEDPADKR